MLSNKTLLKKSMTVQFNFSDTSMTLNVKVMKSGLWTDQAQQDWCHSLIMHALTDIAQKVCKKKQGQQPTQTNKRRVLVETENESVVSLGYIRPGMGAKAHRPAISPRDRSRNPYKSPPTMFLKSVLCGHFCLLHLGIPPTISSHTSIWVCISVVFNTTQDGSKCLSVSYSAPHEMAVSVSLYQPHLHIRWQFLPLSVILNTIQDGS